MAQPVDPLALSPRPAEHEIDALKTVVIQLRRELENKQGYAGRLEMLLRSRTERIDQLNGQLEQVRAQNRRLDEEAERLAEMVRLSPGDAP